MYYYGKNTVRNIIDSNEIIDEVLISKKFKDSAILNLLSKNRINYQQVDEIKLDVLTKRANHQGIVVKVNDFKYHNFDEMIRKNENNPNSLFVFLDGLEDPQNFGSIIRSAEALQISGIVIPKNRSVRVNPTVAKVSTGAINYVDIAQVTNLKQELTKLKEAGYWIVGAHMDTDVMYDQVDYNMKMALVIGSEGKGLSQQIRKECDYLVKLPMYGKVSSLNAAVSAAIIMYQINSCRQK